MSARTRVAIRAPREPLCAPVIGRTDGRPARPVPATASRPGGRKARHGLLPCVVLSTCMTLACSTISVTAPDVATGLGAPASSPASAERPDEPRHEASLPGLLPDLARIVGRESVDRGDALLRMFRERGFDPHIHEFSVTATDRQPRDVGRNLVVTIGEGRRDIVVGAHYDVVRLRDGAVVGGAVDNGAASVVLTRVAETLRRHELNHRVRVILFDLEEAGLLGSRAYVQDEDGDRIAAMVNADVVAGDGALMYGPTSHEGNEAVYRSLLVVCADSEVPCMAFPRYPSSDDRSFQAAGIPNVSIAMNGATASHQMWLALNAGAESGLSEGFLPDVFRVIHSAEDSIERASETAMNRLHDVIVALVLELDGAL